VANNKNGHKAACSISRDIGMGAKRQHCRLDAIGIVDGPFEFGGVELDPLVRIAFWRPYKIPQRG
jgi:hypothetical protein